MTHWPSCCAPTWLRPPPLRPPAPVVAAPVKPRQERIVRVDEAVLEDVRLSVGDEFRIGRQLLRVAFADEAGQ